jgi:hypothetical protein
LAVCKLSVGDVNMDLDRHVLFVSHPREGRSACPAGRVS